MEVNFYRNNGLVITIFMLMILPLIAILLAIINLDLNVLNNLLATLFMIAITLIAWLVIWLCRNAVFGKIYINEKGIRFQFLKKIIKQIEWEEVNYACFGLGRNDYLTLSRTRIFADEKHLSNPNLLFQFRLNIKVSKVIKHYVFLNKIKVAGIEKLPIHLAKIFIE